MDWLTAQRPLLLGHRGASGYLPENTLAAFALAVEQGADGFEFDVQLSADGRLVVIHDFTVDRTTNGAGKVADLTLAELQALDAGEGQSIPTLDDLFETFGASVLYNIEIKAYGLRDKGAETAVADRVQSHNLENRVLVSSFSPLSVRRARRALSAATPVALIRSTEFFSKYNYWFADGQADHPHFSMVDESYMRWAKKRGWRVHVWTVDDPEEARRLIRLGVHALISNKPDRIRSALSRN